MSRLAFSILGYSVDNKLKQYILLYVKVGVVLQIGLLAVLIGIGLRYHILIYHLTVVFHGGTSFFRKPFHFIFNKIIF